LTFRRLYAAFSSAELHSTTSRWIAFSCYKS